MESYIEDKKNLYTSVLEFLEGYDAYSYDEFNQESFQNLIDVIQKQQIEGNREEIYQFLEIIKSIGENHHRYQQFNDGINQIFEHYQDQIKQTLSNLEIFHIFENNKKIVLFLLKANIITISDKIYKEMINKIENNGNRYCHFFIPELESFIGEDKIKFLKNELLNDDPNIFTDYEKKRDEGENEAYICSLIRQDSVKEFISYVNRYNISLSSQISLSIFETNPFLIDNNKTTLIEYSAFFGSIQIFRYLLMNKAELTPSLWLYGIHSKNAELIHLLESNEVAPPIFYIKGKEYDYKNSSQDYKQCLIECIKCHHNDIADYIENNLLNQNESDLQQNEEIISYYIQYHNFTHFQNDFIIDHCFFYLYFNQYNKLVELLLKKKEKLIEEKINQYQNIQDAINSNDVEVIYHYLLKEQEISEKLFKGTKIKRIAIPSSVTSIGYSAFAGCSSLTQISIPSSVTSIRESAFERCLSLTQITIPPSVTSIGHFAFAGCSSLTQISIPSSVILIGESAFKGCKSLTQITIPSSVTSIGYLSFKGCTKLTKIIIPSSVISIGNYAFEECSSLSQIIISSSVISIGEGSFSRCKSLTQITIPSSVKIIGNSTFSGCSSLTQITIPSSVTSIGSFVFCECSSLTQIIIPSSVTSIGDSAFDGCSSLTQITIPSSVTSIGDSAFKGCSSLTQISFEIPSYVKNIKSSAFEGCSSLTQIVIPSSVTKIEYSAFNGCSSLTQITIPSSVTSIGSSAFDGCPSLTRAFTKSSINQSNLEIDSRTRIDTINEPACIWCIIS